MKSKQIWTIKNLNNKEGYESSKYVSILKSHKNDEKKLKFKL